MTKQYTVINTSTNAVLRHVTCLESDKEHNCAVGETIVEGILEPEQATDSVMDVLRAVRDELLTSCDWTQVTDSPLTESKRAEWATYRTALRNLPSSNSSTTSIEDVTWPTEPS